ncbi:MAG: lipopolysaccharide biosynthesis protein [Gammaproteobacteria bacterium]|nr:lipopolysaccharide biosynthesis protein [Gammaproteobacteria bacterium]
MNRLFQSRNNKFAYYLKGHSKRLYPKFLLKLNLDKLQKSIKDFDEQKMYDRLDYYHQVNSSFGLDDSVHRIKDIGSKHGVYSLDLMEYTRFFPQEYKLSYLFGDITHVPSVPAVTKSRPIGDNDNSILMKFDKVRHFYMVKNDIKFQEKKNALIWRGAVCQPHRIKFMEEFFNKSNLINAGDFNKGANSINNAWKVPFTSIQDQLEYKFILSIEGNDVATSTKWIMSSNSLLFMTKPKFETWLMEGKLTPNFHYVLVNDDYSNLEEKINYYIENANEAEEIISNANSYMDQFKNAKSEDWLHLKILERYFKLSGQMT